LDCACGGLPAINVLHTLTVSGNLLVAKYFGSERRLRVAKQVVIEIFHVPFTSSSSPLRAPVVNVNNACGNDRSQAQHNRYHTLITIFLTMNNARPWSLFLEAVCIGL
jgi:hypothetical protein